MPPFSLKKCDAGTNFHPITIYFLHGYYTGHILS